MFTLYSADISGNPGNCSYPHRHDVTDEASLKAAICHDYVCAEYKNNYRNGDNFIGSDCLPVDCDNDHSEELDHTGRCGRCLSRRQFCSPLQPIP